MSASSTEADMSRLWLQRALQLIRDSRKWLYRLVSVWSPVEASFRVKLLLLVVVLLACILLAMSTGAVEISVQQSLLIIAANAGMAVDAGSYTAVQDIVLSTIRAPRIFLGVLVGASLAVCGAALQGVFRNPLADPALIGVSSGAALFAVIVIVLGSAIFGAGAASIVFALPVAAFCGGVLTSLVVYRFATVEGTTDVATMLLAGIAITAIAGAGLGILTFYADDEQLRTLTFWTMGSLGGVTWMQLLVATPFMLLPILFIPLFSSFLNAMLLGEAEAGHLGFRLQRSKLIMILLVSMAVGAAVSLSGIIGFVGLVVPHLVRLVAGPDHRFLLPASALLGAIILLLADMLARTVVSPAELPIGIITAMLGGPFFLWLLNRRRRRVRF